MMEVKNPFTQCTVSSNTSITRTKWIFLKGSLKRDFEHQVFFNKTRCCNMRNGVSGVLGTSSNTICFLFRRSEILPLLAIVSLFANYCTRWRQGYTAGRGYMCLAVAVCSGRGWLFLFAENIKKIRFKYYFNHLNPQYLSSNLIIQLQVSELFLLV